MSYRGRGDAVEEANVMEEGETCSNMEEAVKVMEEEVTYSNMVEEAMEKVEVEIYKRMGEVEKEMEVAVTCRHRVVVKGKIEVLGWCEKVGNPNWDEIRMGYHYSSVLGLV